MKPTDNMGNMDSFGPGFDDSSSVPAPPSQNYKAAPRVQQVSTGAVLQISREQLDMASLKKMDIPDVRSRIQTEFESNRGYQMVADKIITVSQKHLADQQRDKVALRKQFATLFSVLLILEYVALVIFIIVGLLNQIIQNYQKFQIDAPPKEPKA